MHPEARLKGESLDFCRKARVSLRAEVIDGRLLSIRLRSEEDECRFYIYNEAWHSVPGLYLLDKFEFYYSSLLHLNKSPIFFHESHPLSSRK